jgi:hypothetical protein
MERGKDSQGHSEVLLVVICATAIKTPFFFSVVDEVALEEKADLREDKRALEKR